jgi:uncharacterized YigZ family protein
MEKGSKFLARIMPIDNEGDAQVLLASLKKLHPKARHFCTAIRLGSGSVLERSNDDGEPSGSAGKPILGQLIKHDLTNVSVVVVRYFGGTKLGIPGLIEAYKTSTADAISHATIVERLIYSTFSIAMKYEAFPSFKNHVLQAGLPVIEEVFQDRATMVLGFRKSTADQDLLALLKEFSRLDFNVPEAYGDYLDFKIVPLKQEIII